MSAIADRLEAHGTTPAIIRGDGLRLSYADLAGRVSEFCDRLGRGGRLLVIEAENELDPIIAYLAGLKSRNPVMLIPAGRDDLRQSVIDRYAPEWIFAKTGTEWALESRSADAGEITDGIKSPDSEQGPTRRVDDRDAPHPELAVLLCTSGSTGAAKFVRLSHENIESNAQSIIEYLGIEPTDCAATTLPFHYSYGFSVLNTHLLAGATLMLTDASVVDPEFWEACSAHQVSSFAGVPYTFELLDRIDFERRPLPSLRYITQAGGRLPVEQVKRYAEMGRRAGWQLFVMYGQTEASPRMAYVPPDRLEDHPDAIGVPVPGGTFHLVDESGSVIETPDQPGELVYRGANVMMGYAEERADLARGQELQELHTGDLAEQTPDGLYRIVGRTSRFIKVFGLRISLDEVERRLTAQGIRAVATGVDESLVVATLETDAEERIRGSVANACQLPIAVVSVRAFDDYPLLPSGKIDYSAIRDAARPATEAPSARGRDIRRIIADGTHALEIRDESTFVNLGGDSLSYIRVSLELESLLGYVPAGWERQTVARLEALPRRTGAWRQIETSILLRAAAIVVIVCNHFGLFDAQLFQRTGFAYPRGAAIVLLVIAGFNFARFQWPRAVDMGPAPILLSVARVALPTVLFLLAVELVSGKFVLSTILMYSNFIGPNVNHGIEPWFIYLLLQILLLLAIPFAIPAFREIAKRSPYGVALGTLALATFASLAGPFVWDTEHLYTRVPHMLLYAFALGICIEFGQQTWQKLLHSAVLAIFLVLVMSHFTWFVLAGGLVLIWTQHLWLVWPINRLAGSIGGASLFIYLSHHNFQQYAHRILGTDSFMIDLVVALVGGVVLWALWERGVVIAEQVFRAVSARVGPAAANGHTSRGGAAPGQK